MTEQKPEFTLSVEEMTQGQPMQPLEPESIGAQEQPQTVFEPMQRAESFSPPAIVASAPEGTVVSSPNAETTYPAASAAMAANLAQTQPEPPTSAPPQLNSKDRAVQLAHQHKHRLRPIGYALGGFLLFIVLFNFQLIAQQIGYFLNPPKPAENMALQDPNAVTTNASIVSPESVIIIPKINVSAPIVYADSVAEDEVMKDLESGVVHYANTAKPGENGNAVIFGHSSNDWWESGDYKFVFALLGKLEVGDQVQVNYSSRKYVYEVTEKKVVEPSEVSVLNPTPNPVLTLITCTPPGTAWQRLIIVAKQIQPSPDAEPVEQVASAQKPGQQPVENPAKPASIPSNAPSIGEQIGSIWTDVVAFFTPEQREQTGNQEDKPAGPQRLPEVS